MEVGEVEVADEEGAVEPGHDLLPLGLASVAGVVLGIVLGGLRFGLARLHAVSFIRDTVTLRLEASKDASFRNCSVHF